jgi:hypothetical protein
MYRPLCADLGRCVGSDPVTMIDLGRYPVHDLGSPRTRTLIEDCQAQLAKSGSCVLDGFLTGQAVAATSDEARRLTPLAHRTPNSRSTAYLEAPDEGYPESHPKRRLQRTSVGAVAYDLAWSKESMGDIGLR